MIPFQYGDIVCYRHSVSHEEVILMVVGECRHDPPRGNGLIELLDIESCYLSEINCKDPAMWQICTHLPEGPI